MNNGTTKRVVVDAGHGGVDPGASGNGIVEKDYNLRIANYIYDRLNELGIPVTIIRDTDTTLSPNDRVNAILDVYGDDEDVIVLSNHLNAGGGKGAEVVYALRNNDTLSQLILEEIAKEGQTIRKWYQRRLPSNPSKDYYFIHRLTGNTEPVLIEYGFVDNPEDASFIRNNWKNLAEATVRAVANYIGEPITEDSENIIYTVQRGDSLYSIAKKFDVTVADIKVANNLQNNLISVGQKLVIPGFVAPTYSTINYVVQRGDSLYSIANRYNTTVNRIKEINGLTNNTLSIGDVLQIPSAEIIDIEVDTTSPSNTYTVQYGDTLYSIAADNNFDVDELIRLNNLTDYSLYVGQILKIPTYAGEEVIGENEYVVQRGDSLYAIARRYNTTVDELKRLNNLTTNALEIGQILRIPTTTEIIEPIPQVGNTYIVQAGDNLYAIATSNNTTVDEIKRLNNLTSNLLNIGQVLQLPSIAAENTTYIVKSGDTLYAIAREYNTTANAIRELNNLTSNVLSVGQTLRIPF